MFIVIFTVHISLCVALILLVLIQQGKGADAGAIMGGGTDSVLGAGSAGSAISKLTTSLAIGFMITSIMLVRTYDSRTMVSTTPQKYDALDGSVLGGGVESKPAETLTEGETSAAGALVTEETEETSAPEAKEGAASTGAAAVVGDQEEAATGTSAASEENQGNTEKQAEVPAEGSTESKESDK